MSETVVGTKESQRRLHDRGRLIAFGLRCQGVLNDALDTLNVDEIESQGTLTGTLHTY